MHYFIILDDDHSHNEFVVKKLNHIIQNLKQEAKVVLYTTNPNEVLHYSARNKVRKNIYLLDVDVKDSLTGIDVAARIRSQEANAYIVFISAHPEYVMPCLKTKIFDYLIKPVSIETLENCIGAIINDFIQTSKKRELPKLSIKSGFELYHIPLEEIVYMEKYGHLLVVHTITSRIEGSESLDKMEQKLDMDNFFRCHKSYIVNIAFISHIDYQNNIIFLKNGEKCMVSKRNKKGLRLLCNHS